MLKPCNKLATKHNISYEYGRVINNHGHEQSSSDFGRELIEIISHTEYFFENYNELKTTTLLIVLNEIVK